MTIFVAYYIGVILGIGTGLTLGWLLYPRIDQWKLTRAEELRDQARAQADRWMIQREELKWQLESSERRFEQYLRDQQRRKTRIVTSRPCRCRCGPRYRRRF